MARLTLSSTIKLSSGFEIPTLGLGVYQNHSCIPAVEAALKHGYRFVSSSFTYLHATTHAHKLILWHQRHIDTAQVYRNEVDVGKAIQQSGVKREDIFVSECSDRVWRNFILVDWFKGCTNLFLFSLAILLSSTMLVWDIRGWVSTLRGGVEPIKAVCLERNLFALIVRLTVIDYTPLGFNLRSPPLPSARSRSSFLTYKLLTSLV